MNISFRVLGLSVLLFAPMVFAAPKTAAPTSYEKKVRLLLELTGPGDALTKQVTDNMLKNVDDQAFAARFRAEAHKDDLVSRLIPVYAKHLNEADLDAAIAFYQTPAGKHMIAAQTVLPQESMAVTQEWGADLTRRAQAQ
jgi:hypothetical protein